MSLEDMMMESRIHEILTKKALIEGGELVGGARRRRMAKKPKKKMSQFNVEVKKYLRKHPRASLPEAAKKVSAMMRKSGKLKYQKAGSKSSRRKTSKRRVVRGRGLKELDEDEYGMGILLGGARKKKRSTKKKSSKKRVRMAKDIQNIDDQLANLEYKKKELEWKKGLLATEKDISKSAEDDVKKALGALDFGTLTYKPEEETPEEFVKRIKKLAKTKYELTVDKGKKPKKISESAIRKAMRKLAIQQIEEGKA